MQEIEAAGAAGLTIEDTVLPQAYGQAKPQVISIDEGAGKMKAALDGRSDLSLVIVGRTGAASITNIDDTVARAKAYEAAGVDALFFTGLKTRAELQAIAAVTKLPIIMGSADGELADMAFLASQRVRVANQGHQPIAAATQAVYETQKALRDGVAPKDLKGLPPRRADQSRDARCRRESAHRGFSGIEKVGHDPEKHALGLDPWVGHRFRTRSLPNQ